MTRRLVLPVIPLTLTLFLAACGGDEPPPEQAPPVAEPAATQASADEAAIDELRAGWVQHYNLHHPDMVADFYTDSAFVLGADQSVDEGREAIEASLAEAMAANPTVDVEGMETMVFGDHAVTVGRYELQMSPEGAEPMSSSGHYLNYLQRVDGEWKIVGLLTNFDEAPPADFAWAEPTDDMPPEEGTLTELVEGYETHWNLQHPDMVADFYTDDAWVSFANRAVVEGRDGVAAALQERATEMPTQIDIHSVGTMDLGDGWALDGGWYELTAAEGGALVQTGMYMNLVRRMDDGTMKVHWSVANGQPMGG